MGPEREAEIPESSCMRPAVERRAGHERPAQGWYVKVGLQRKTCARRLWPFRELRG